MIRPAACLRHTVQQSIVVDRTVCHAPRFVRARARPCVVLSIGNGDAQPESKEEVSSSVRASLSGRALPFLRSGFLQAVAALLEPRFSNIAQESEAQQECESPMQTVESPVLYVQVGEEDEEEIAAVTKDDIEPSILWEQRRKDVEAEKARSALTSPGFSFSAAGLLFPYHLGVGQCLIERGYITKDTPLAGSSAGALVCAVIASGLSMHDAMRATKELAYDCRINGTAFRLGAVLREFLERFLPDDAHIRSSGNIRVAITQVFRSPRGLLVDQFDSKADLINALHTSCFIPGYLAPRPVTLYRNRICIDGGLTLFMPPTAADVTIRVCAFPTVQLGLKGIGISPDCNPSMGRASTRQLLNWALEPAEDEVLDHLFNLGYQDALVWTAQHELSKNIMNDEADLPSSSLV